MENSEKPDSHIVTNVKVGGGFVLNCGYGIIFEVMSINPALNQVKFSIKLPRFMKFIPVKKFAISSNGENNDKSKKTA